MTDTQALTHCKQLNFGFQDLGAKKVEADFSGGHLSSDGGTLLLRELDGLMGLSRKLSKCFSDFRDNRWVEHQLPTLLAQRIHGIALGYEDINDHERLRLDPLFAVSCGREDLLGEQRLGEDKGKPLAGKSTLNRLELGAEQSEGHYRKIQVKRDQVEDLLVEMGVKAIARKSKIIILDFDATDDRIHGEQEGRFYHGYYRNYCYLPLYCFCGDIPLWAELQKSDQDASKGTLEALKKILRHIRKRFGKKVRVIVRGDSGFCREELMSWIEAQPKVNYCFGLARNARLEKMIEPAFEQTLEELGYYELILAAQAAGASSLPGIEQLPGSTRCFEELRYQTLKSWSRARRVIGKAEVTNGKKNPRYIVTDIEGDEEWAENVEELKDGKNLYEKFYCARGEMENKIKEQQLDLFADRTSSHYMTSNQLRLWFSTFAYLLLSQLRRGALKGTRLGKATVGTIRTRLLKIAAHLSVSHRRVYVQLASACPVADVFAVAHARLRLMEGWEFDDG